MAVLGDAALVNAEDAQLANKRVYQHLEHMGDSVLLRIGDRWKFFNHGAVALDQGFGIAFERIGQQLGKDIEQFLYSCPGAGRNKTDGNQVAFTQRLLEWRMQLIRLQIIPLFQIDRHQVLVHLDHLVDQGRVGGGDAGKITVARRIEKAVHHAGAAIGR